MDKKQRIIIFGLSGSGKSTLADELGGTLGLRVIHPSGILRDLIEGRVPDIAHSQAGQGYWESIEEVKAFKDRLQNKLPLDFVCDQILLEEIKKGDVVIDSWSLPWLTDQGIKLCLKADLSTRVQRVAQRSGVHPETARRVIQLKDSGTRKLYLEHKHFDIKKDHAVFSASLPTDNLSIADIRNWALQHL